MMVFDYLDDYFDYFDDAFDFLDDRNYDYEQQPRWEFSSLKSIWMIWNNTLR